MATNAFGEQRFNFALSYCSCGLERTDTATIEFSKSVSPLMIIQSSWQVMGVTFMAVKPA